MEDRELVNKAKKDINAFEELYNKYFPMINRFVYHKVSDEETRRDIVSNTFMKAMKNLYKFKYLYKGAFSGWIYRIAMNEVTDFYRKSGRSRKLDREVKHNIADPLGEDIHIDYSNLKVGISRLSEKDQNIIILKYFEKKSNKELAEIFNKKEGAVKVQLHRAMKKLKKIMINLEGSNDGEI